MWLAEKLDWKGLNVISQVVGKGYTLWPVTTHLRNMEE
jgi:hypothetical protein